MAAILNSAIFDSAICTKINFTLHSHSTWWWQPSWILPSWIQPSWIQKNFTCYLTLIMAAILNSAILDSTILHKKTSLIHSDSTWWWQPSWILPSWIQPFWHQLPSWIQTSCYLFSDSLKNTLTPLLTLTQTNSIWIHTHIQPTWWWQPSWILPSRLDSAILHKKNFTHFILTQLDDGSHLELCHVGFRHCHLGFRHLVIFSQIHSKTLSLHSDSDSN